MEFQEKKAIYLQLAEQMCFDILEDVHKADERIPSVREVAAQMEVNANTAVRSYEWLEQKGIIYTKRGLGFFVTTDAKDIILKMQREEFINNTLPSVFKTMKALGLSIEDVEKEWRKEK